MCIWVCMHTRIVYVYVQICVCREQKLLWGSSVPFYLMFWVKVLLNLEFTI